MRKYPKTQPSLDTYINLEDAYGRFKSLKALNITHQDDGWLYFDTEDENGVIQRYRMKPNE